MLTDTLPTAPTLEELRALCAYAEKHLLALRDATTGEVSWNIAQARILHYQALDYLDHAIDPAWRDHLPVDPTA